MEQCTNYYKTINTSPSIIDGSFPEGLNTFYPCWYQGKAEPTIKAEFPPGDLSLIFSTSDVCSTLR